MKKLLIAVCFMLGFAGISSAQVPAKKPVDKTVTKPVTAKVIKMDKSKTAGAVPLKADGTPDKRFKQSKKATAAAPLKKDGTPDKRFKANKKG
jgi:hypothetical protein